MRSYTFRESSRNITLARCVTNSDRMFCYSHVAVPIEIISVVVFVLSQRLNDKSNAKGMTEAQKHPSINKLSQKLYFTFLSRVAFAI